MLQPLPNQNQLPTDPNRDGSFEDVDGNGVIEYQDVVVYFQNFEWIQSNEPLGLFDYNKNGMIDYADIVYLYQHLPI